jgi:DNA-binding transcriptional MerR regulator
MPVEIDGKKYFWALEVCRQARISRSTLLRWLKRGVIQEPIKDRRGWRIFSEEDLIIIRAEVERTCDSPES